MHGLTGTLRYSNEDGEYWLVADVDPDLAAYYRALLPKAAMVKRGRYDAHITVVRGGRDVPANLAAWGKHAGERVELFYEAGLLSSGPYYWLPVLSERLEAIRLELGLGLDNGAYAAPPAPFAKYWHITVGNTKAEGGPT